MCELLTESEFNPDKPYENLAIPVKDLVRYWWNNLADQEDILQIVMIMLVTNFKSIIISSSPHICTKF